MGSSFRKILPYLVAVAAVACAGYTRSALMTPILGDRVPFGVFTFAVIISAWFGGLLPGLLATMLSLLAGYTLFMAPNGPLTPPGIVMLCVSALNGVLISLACEYFHRNRRLAEKARQEFAAGQVQLADAEERQRNILAAVPQIIWQTDAAGHLLFANERWNEISSGAAGEHAWLALAHLDDVEVTRSKWDHARAKGETFEHEFRLRFADDIYRWHLVRIIPSRTGGEEITGWLGSATDVDSAHHAADLLRANEERFRRLADSAPILIWTTDAENAVSWVNKPWLDFSGRPLSAELGQGWIEGTHPEDYQRVADHYHASTKALLPFEMDFRLRRRDGEYIWMMARGTPIFAGADEFLGYVGGCTDINERKMAEENSELMLKSEQSARLEAERTAQLKDEFLATVSHEMRTPLTAMLGWVQLLRSGSLPTETVPQALETIERNARAQAKLIDDLLDMSRILSGRLRLDVQTVNILEAVEAAIAAAEPAAVAKKVRLLRVLDSRIGPVSGDPTRIQQIIWNLASNAVKFTPAGGTITITLERVNSHLEISVSDTGEGILPEFLPYVFDRFRQQDASTSRRHQGLGLGLSIAKQLVELHGGSIRAKSPGLGQGSTFIIALPIAPVHAGLPEREEHAPVESEPFEEVAPSLLGTKILVVDDDADARELLRSILSQGGASVRTADSVRDALRQFDARPPDVLVSDIGMPGEDGYSLIKQVRAMPREAGGQVPALALTAFARSDDRRRAISAGFHMHLAKPVEPAELVTVVASLAKRDR